MNLRCWMLVLALVVGVVSGCGHSSQYAGRAVDEYAGVPMEAPPPVPDMAFGAMRGAAVMKDGAPMQVNFAMEGIGVATVPGDGVADKPISTSRKIVYTGTVGLRVANKRTTATQVEAVITKYAGFISRSSLDEIVFRVKPENFDAAMADLEALGEVTAREVYTEDITEQYTDVELRIETAEKSRQRLLDLLQNVKETKDVIEVERDIRRLTEELETMKGRLRVLADKVDLATITVRLEERMPDQIGEPRWTAESPFAWVRDTGIAQSLVAVDENARLRYQRHVVLRRSPFELASDREAPVPAGFTALEHRRALLIAGTAEDYRLRARAVETRQANTLDFWAKAMLTELVDSRGYQLLKDEAAVLDDGELAGRRLSFELVYRGVTWNYDVWLVQEDEEGEEEDEIVVIEFARLKTADESTPEHLTAVEESIAGITLR